MKNQKNQLTKSSIIAYDIVAEMASLNDDFDKNGPRTRQSDNRGYVSDKCIKRKIRDMIDPSVCKRCNVSPERGNIFESRLRGMQTDDPVKAAKLARKMIFDNFEASLQYFWDNRMCGVMPLSKDEEVSGRKNISQGACQFDMPVSLNPVEIQVATCTKKYSLREQLIKEEQGDVAPDAIKVVEFGLYFGMIHINAVIGKECGVTESDVNMLRFIVPRMFDRRSAQRSGVYIAQCIAAEHLGEYQTFSDFAFRTAAMPKMKIEPTEPATSINDYEMPTIESIQEVVGKKGKVWDLMPGQNQ